VTTRSAWILAIGDELVLGRCADTNSSLLARRLSERGFAVRGITVVGDALDDVAAAIRAAAAQTDLVVATGGLGPTEDDRTRHAAARAAGVELRFDEEGWTGIRSYFARLGRPIPDSNRRQALLPESAERLPNASGSAPGFALPIGAARFVALPGVPRELAAMLDAELLPRLDRWFGGAGALALRELHLLGPSEATAGERLAPWLAERTDATIGITASGGLLTLRVAARAAEAAAAGAAADAIVAELRPRVAEWIVLDGDGPLAAAALARLRASGLRLALAESCTGGMLAQQLTDVAGSSDVLLAGYVCYANDAKSRDLGVDARLLDKHGAVSVEVAAAMAEGGARRSGADVALAVTGIAGPSGGSAHKPVGTVCFGMWRSSRSDAWQLRIADLGRDFIRRRACHECWGALLRALGST
jgi:nicotinamide-nucleotide amidase